jgi:hypothetical protein
MADGSVQTSSQAVLFSTRHADRIFGAHYLGARDMIWLARSLQEMISFDRGELFSDGLILVSEQVRLIRGEC